MHFHTFGEIKSIVLSQKSKCAFINYVTKEAADLAFEKSYNSLSIRGHNLRIQWGKSKAQGPKATTAAATAVDSMSNAAVDPDHLPPIPAPPGVDTSIAYASTDPNLLGFSAKTYRV
jgi:pre-mRNA-splicing factor RBM22/SLT11